MKNSSNTTMDLIKTLKNFFAVIFASGFARGIAFLNTVIIARSLSPEKFGEFSIFYFIMVLVWQLPQAFDTTFVRYAKMSNCHIEKNEFLKTAIFLKLIFFGMVLIFSYPLSFFASKYFFHNSHLRNTIIAAIISGSFLTFLMTVASVYQEKENFGVFAILHSFYTVSVFIILIFSKLSKTVFSVEMLTILYFSVCAVIGLSSLLFLYRKTGSIINFRKEILYSSFSLGKWIFGAFAGYFLFQQLGVLFLARYEKYTAVGNYSIAQQFIMMISLITASLAGVFLPKASRALESEKLFRIYVRESLAMILLIISFIISLIFLAPLLVKFLYGGRYLDAVIIMRILCAGWIMYALYLPFYFLFYTLDDSKTAFFLEIFKVTLGVILLFILTPAFGNTGAAWSISAAMALHALLSIYVLNLKLKYSISYNK